MLPFRALRMRNPSTAGGSGYSFYRLYVVDNNGNSVVAVDELEFRGSSGGADLTSTLTSDGTTAFASRVWVAGATDAYRAFDGSNSSAWASDVTTNQWVAYKFGSAQTIAQISMLANANNARSPKNFRLEGSNDSTNGSDGTWTTVLGPFVYNANYSGSVGLPYPENLGAERVTDPGFDNPGSWSATGGWSISGSNAVGSSASNRLSQTGVFVSGKVYKVVFSYTYTGGSPSLAKLRILTNAANVLYLSPALGTSGTITAYLLADGTEFRLEADSAVFTGTIPSISVKEVT